MANVVKSPFIDKITGKRYKKGDSYNHKSDKRIAFLIEEGFLANEEVEPEFPKHTGGGWYELSNGEKVQGKEESFVAEKKIGE